MPGGWFYNDVSGDVRYDSGVSYYADLFARAIGTGWNGPYKTEALALQHKGVVGAKATPNENPLQAALHAGGHVAATTSGIGQPLQDVGDFFHRLTEKETWVRVGEVGLGGILIYAAIRALTHGSAVTGAGARQSATRPVKKAAKTITKVAAPEVRLASRTVAKRAAPKTTARVAKHRARAAKYGAHVAYHPS